MAKDCQYLSHIALPIKTWHYPYFLFGTEIILSGHPFAALRNQKPNLKHLKGIQHDHSELPRL